MSYKTFQFWRVDTDILVSYKAKCLERINGNSNGREARKHWFDRLESVETELNKRYNEMYQKQNRSEEFANFLNKRP
jgi:hypothetical protein